MNHAHVSIIIVNWRSVRYLQKCLKTIYENMGQLTAEIIVIDNASFDGCNTLLSEEYPNVRFIQNHSNIGFAGANNIAYRHSRGRTLLFLNPDTEIIDDAIPSMYRLLWEHSDAGAIGCTLLNTDGSLQTSCIQMFPTILNQVADAEMLRRRFPLLPLWGTGPLFKPMNVPIAVDVVSGACLMVKRDVFESVGLFSTDYFMYAEDTDLCYKIRSLGKFVYYTGSAAVIHHGGGSSRQQNDNFAATVVMCESLRRFMIKHYGQWYGYLYRLAMCGVSIGRLMILAIMRLGSSGSDARSREAIRHSFGKWRRVLQWSLSL